MWPSGTRGECHLAVRHALRMADRSLVEGYCGVAPFAVDQTITVPGTGENPNGSSSTGTICEPAAAAQGFSHLQSLASLRGSATPRTPTCARSTTRSWSNGQVTLAASVTWPHSQRGRFRSGHYTSNPDVCPRGRCAPEPGCDLGAGALLASQEVPRGRRRECERPSGTRGECHLARRVVFPDGDQEPSSGRPGARRDADRLRARRRHGPR